MTETGIEGCLEAIQAGYLLAGRGFDGRNPTLVEMYRDTLDRATIEDRPALLAIKGFVQRHDRAPKVAELADLLRTCQARPNDADAYKTPIPEHEPGHAYRLMREGYLAHRRRVYGDEYIHADMDAVMKQIAERNEEKRQTWRANQTADGFAARPGITLDPPVSRDSRPAAPTRLVDPAPYVPLAGRSAFEAAGWDRTDDPFREEE